MTGFDYTVLVIIGLSVLLAVFRGGLSEIISLAAWVLAFWLAENFAPALADLLPADLPGTKVRLIAAFISIFLGVWFVSALLRITVGQFIKAIGLGPLDRLIGALFGMARGAVIVLALVVVAGLTSVPKLPIWRNAMLSPPFEAAATALKPWLPEPLSKHMLYE
jgi:membrane protein required for colicin V production